MPFDNLPAHNLTTRRGKLLHLLRIMEEKRPAGISVAAENTSRGVTPLWKEATQSRLP